MTYQLPTQPQISHIDSPPSGMGREARLARALQRILSAADGDPRFEPMNWSDVAEVARRALDETGNSLPPYNVDA